MNRKQKIRKMLKARYTYKEIGIELGVSKPRAFQLSHYYFTEAEIEGFRVRKVIHRTLDKS